MPHKNKKVLSGVIRWRGLLFTACSKVAAVLAALIALSLLAQIALPEAHANTPTNDAALLCQVTRVIDGDTLVAQCPKMGEVRVRLIGVDTPETKHPNKPVEHFGKEASAFTKKMAEGKTVRLDMDANNAARKHRCRYGRLLAYVFVKQADGSFFDLNAQIIAQGYGHAYTRFPFSRMEEFRRLERAAREAGRGLWAKGGKPGETTTSTQSQPPALPQTSPTEKCYVQDGRCLIKGNINAKGKRIYHLPGMQFYERTQIDESKGERWFCTEEEAKAAGWVKSRR